ncbi:WbuC family cupin fold metalloprotein [Helicobacter sp. WB40]|uniref:WbuC family cupin fold metalloprotein n=1 Tax=Helicobacter sp. WB40 TaxID=3004130 RepID=UPI0022EBBFF8|nr:WbuC family cupin fold metalloprotein [Helicobacter sp. WB40]MDA3967434.1 WbuC family cupin fold metalloprotein [Helicobacter sp. WB40]
MSLIETKDAKSPTFYKEDSNFSYITNEDIEFVKNHCKEKKQSTRICLHRNGESDLHNMLIAHLRGNYIRPHKNPTKSKAYQIVDGDMRIIGINYNEEKLFDINLANEKILRIEKDIYLLLLPVSEVVVFHEIALGPFIASNSLRGGGQIYASFSPQENDKGGINEFVAKYTKGTYNWL